MKLESKRFYFFDNAKLILIFLVVIGHIIEPLIGRNSFKTIYIFIYSFHMPAFIIVSGFFAKSFTVNNQKLKLVNKLLFPYILFETIYSIFHYFIFNTTNFKLSLMTPYWILWFLLSLFFWHFMLLFFLELKKPLVYAVILSVLVGYLNDVGYYLSLSRTITFFPFFLLGYYVQQQHFKQLADLKKRLLALSFLIVVFFILYKFAPGIKVQWFYGSLPYRELGCEVWYAGVYRTIILISGFVMSLAFFALIPQNKTFFTDWGSRTIYVFLLHGFIMKFVVHLDIYQSIDSLWDMILLISLAGLITWLLSIRQIQTMSNKFKHFTGRLPWRNI